MDRIEAYSLLSDMIYKGFITVDLSLEGKSFVFKTLNSQEVDLIKLCAGNPKKTGYRERFDLHYLAYSLLAVDGDNVLKDRQSNTESLVKMFAGMPGKFSVRVGRELSDLARHSYDALKFVEGFCYTDQSRRAWRVSGGIPPNDERLTGLPGTSSMGMNFHQETWSLINKGLDDEEQYNIDFSLALFVASATNAKGCRQARAQHDSNQQNSKDRRKRLAEMGFVDTTQWAQDKWSAKTDTAEELVAELDRQMHGMKDRHDLFIEMHMKRLKDKADRTAKEATDRIRKVREEQGTLDDLLSGSQRALTQEETRELMKRKVTPGVMKVADEDNIAGSSDHSRFLKKMGSTIMSARR